MGAALPPACVAVAQTVSRFSERQAAVDQQKIVFFATAAWANHRNLEARLLHKFI